MQLLSGLRRFSSVFFEDHLQRLSGREQHTKSNSSYTMSEAAAVYLGKVIRIVIDDGRLLEGELQCVDKDMNFVLTATTEYYGVPADEAGGVIDITTTSTGTDTRTEEGGGKAKEMRVSSRFLGMATAPGKHIVKVMAAPL